MSDYWKHVQKAIDNLPSFEPHEKAWRWDVARAFQVPAEMLEQTESSQVASARLARDVWLRSMGLMTSAERQANERELQEWREYENQLQAEIYRWQVIDYDMPWLPYWQPKVQEGETE
jgi:hypothetical protein